MKKLCIVLIIIGLILEKSLLGMNSLPHKTLKTKICVSQNEIQEDLDYLLHNGYTRVPINENRYRRIGNYHFADGMSLIGQCYVRSPHGDCVITINLRDWTFTTQY